MSFSLRSTLCIRAVTISVICGINMPVLAGSITRWNTDNVDLAVGPFISGTNYVNPIFQDATKNIVRGGVVWVQGDVSQPGLKIVNKDDINGSNCIMATGINPFDATIKQCSDPIGSNKQFALRADIVDNNGTDLIFNVADTTNISTYQVFQKLTNNSTRRIDRFNIRIGFGVGAGFSASASGDGLAFALANGKSMSAKYYNADPFEPDNLSGLFPFYLFGDNKRDSVYLSSGFFDGTAKASFTVTRGREDELQFSTLSTNYLSRFGRWLSLPEVPYGYFYDDDGNKNTQDLVVGYWDGSVWRDTSGRLIDKEMITSWELDSGYQIGRITGLASFLYRYNINVGSIANWPTYNASSRSATFTIRTLPTYGAGSAVTWLEPRPPMPAPLAMDDRYTIQDRTKSLDIVDRDKGLLSNDRSRTSGVLLASVITQPKAGNLNLRSDGTFTYTPGANFSRKDSFTYLVSDGIQDSAAAIVTISSPNTGCTPLQLLLGSSTTRIDPAMPMLLLGSLGMLFRRRRCNQAR